MDKGSYAMEIRKLEKEDYKKYEIFLLSFKESLLYYSPRYKDFLEELLTVESNYLMALDKDENITDFVGILIPTANVSVANNNLI